MKPIGFVVLLICGLSCVRADDFRGVQIFGNLIKPGSHRLHTEAGVAEFLYEAGWYSPEACPRHVKIKSKDADGKTILERVDVHAIVINNWPDHPLPDDATVFVPSHNFPCMDWKELKGFQQTLQKYVEAIRESRKSTLQ